VVSEDDDQRFVDIAADLNRAATEPARLLTLQGAAHGQRLLDSAHADTVWSALLELVRDQENGR
jgi:hypothetical protein